MNAIGLLTALFLVSACQNSGSPRPAVATPPVNPLPPRGPIVSGPAGAPFRPMYQQELMGQGRWEVIGGVSYFVPNVQLLEGEVEWIPYQHGYWAWEEQYGVTWISYDPWGWLTDHYGIWRHHETFGWVWRPFMDRHYEAHCVSWFGGGETVGWFPYYAPAQELYVREGFNDGFWLGLQLGQSFSINPVFHPGFAIVPRSAIASQNLFTVITTHNFVAQPVGLQMIRTAFQNREVNAFPGGSRQAARVFLERGSGAGPQVALPRTQIVNQAAKTGNLALPQPIHAIPQIESTRVAPLAPGLTPRPGNPGHVPNLDRTGGGLGKPAGAVVPPGAIKKEPNQNQPPTSSPVQFPPQGNPVPGLKGLPGSH